MIYTTSKVLSTCSLAYLMKSAISLDSHLSLSKAGVNAISIFSILSLIRGSSTGCKHVIISL